MSKFATKAPYRAPFYTERDRKAPKAPKATASGADTAASSDLKETHKKVLSVDMFCAEYSISRALLYKLWAEGKGPRRFKAGRRTLICRSAAEDWCQSLEQGGNPVSKSSGAVDTVAARKWPKVPEA